MKYLMAFTIVLVPSLVQAHEVGGSVLGHTHGEEYVVAFVVVALSAKAWFSREPK